MQIVIDIDEDLYVRLFDNGGNNVMDMRRACVAIRNGTPLPKGHGDLKDMEDIYKVLEGWDDDTSWIVDAIDCQATTIIEADKETTNETDN